MKLEDLTYELEQALDVEFWRDEPKTRPDGHEWQTVKIVIHEAVDIGTITFKDGEYYHHKPRKKDSRRDICIIDQKFFRLERYMRDGFIIPLGTYVALVGYAEAISSWDYAKKVKWRRDNPKVDADGKIVPRKPLTGKNPRFILRALVLNVSEDVENCRDSVRKIIEDYFKMPDLARRL